MDKLNCVVLLVAGCFIGGCTVSEESPKSVAPKQGGRPPVATESRPVLPPERLGMPTEVSGKPPVVGVLPIPKVVDEPKSAASPAPAEPDCAQPKIALALSDAKTSLKHELERIAADTRLRIGWEDRRKEATYPAGLWKTFAELRKQTDPRLTQARIGDLQLPFRLEERLFLEQNGLFSLSAHEIAALRAYEAAREKTSAQIDLLVKRNGIESPGLREVEIERSLRPRTGYRGSKFETARIALLKNRALFTPVVVKDADCRPLVLFRPTSGLFAIQYLQTLASSRRYLSGDEVAYARPREGLTLSQIIPPLTDEEALLQAALVPPTAVSPLSLMSGYRGRITQARGLIDVTGDDAYLVYNWYGFAKTLAAKPISTVIGLIFDWASEKAADELAATLGDEDKELIEGVKEYAKALNDEAFKKVSRRLPKVR